jgi:hypothetical protein
MALPVQTGKVLTLLLPGENKAVKIQVFLPHHQHNCRQSRGGGIGVDALRWAAASRPTAVLLLKRPQSESGGVASQEVVRRESPLMRYGGISGFLRRLGGTIFGGMMHGCVR